MYRSNVFGYRRAEGKGAQDRQILGHGLKGAMKFGNALCRKCTIHGVPRYIKCRAPADDTSSVLRPCAGTCHGRANYPCHAYFSNLRWLRIVLQSWGSHGLPGLSLSARAVLVVSRRSGMPSTHTDELAACWCCGSGPSSATSSMPSAGHSLQSSLAFLFSNRDGFITESTTTFKLV